MHRERIYIYRVPSLLKDVETDSNDACLIVDVLRVEEDWTYGLIDMSFVLCLLLPQCSITLLLLLLLLYHHIPL